MGEKQRLDFEIFEDWQGEIVSVADETFDARMIPTYEEGRPHELIVSFNLSNLDETMKKRVKTEATLRWIHGQDSKSIINVFDIDPAPGEVPVESPSTPRLEDLLRPDS